MTNDLLTVWSDNAALSLVIWGVIVITLLYLGRKQAHQVFYSTGRALYRTMRLWSFSLAALEQRIAARNKEVLLAHGAKEAEKSIEREFTRISDIVERDLSQYPALHRQIGDVIDKIEIDYQKAAETAPLPPAWKEVVETITSIPASGDPAVNKILQHVKSAVEDSHNKTLKAFKQASAQRHKLLSDMHPDWRKSQTTLHEINKKVSSLDERSRIIDSQMQTYQDIRNRHDAAADSLAASAITQFFISGLVLIIALLGGLINFQLIAMPMSEMVGGSSYIGTMKTSDIAALAIILIEIAMGLFLMESLRITHLFPIIGSMDDRLRKRMIVVTFTILTILATIEASLAYMRDLLALDREALTQTLTGAGVAAGAVEAQFRWIPSLGQMILGFILPFALAFIAIPLESFIHSLRVVLGTLLIGLLKLLRITARTLGSVANHLCLLCRHLYDLVIVLPLGLERIVKALIQSHGKRDEVTDAELETDPEMDDKTRITRPVIRRKPSGTKSISGMDLADTMA